MLCQSCVELGRNEDSYRTVAVDTSLKRSMTLSWKFKSFLEIQIVEMEIQVLFAELEILFVVTEMKIN